MNLVKLCNLNFCKELCFYAKIHLLRRTYVIQTKHISSASLVSSFKKIKESDFINKARKSNILIVSKMKFYTPQNLDNKNNGEKRVQFTGTKDAKDKPKIGNTKAKTEKKEIDPAIKEKFTQLKSKFIGMIHTKKSRIISMLLGLATLYYFTHLVVSPITKRKKFHIFSRNQTSTLARIQSDSLKKRYKDRIEAAGYNYNRVSNIINSLMKANSDLTETHQGTSWEIFVVNKRESVNFFVFSNGDIFVFSGLLDVVDNDDQLAAVLAHGIAHVLLDHHAQISTWKCMIQSIVLLPLITVYGILPVFIAAPLSPILRSLAASIRHLPTSKSVEREADRLSVEIVSKACFDPRKVKEFWMDMEEMRKKMRINFLRAHPIHKMRYDNFDSQMPKAFNILHKNCTGSLHPFFR